LSIYGEYNKDTNLPAIMVIFGGTGDLTHRKLIPALYNLVHDNILPENFAIVAVGRKERSSDDYRNELLESLHKYSRNKINESHWMRLKDIIHYVQFDFSDQSGYSKLKSFLDELDVRIRTGGNRIFYLAVSPEYFETIVSGIHTSGLSSQVGLEEACY
jgi:glucose-6-phosphate 1-dehydrogenase